MFLIKNNQGNISKWGGGTTREMFIYPQNSTLENRDFIFRISSATININHSVFTDFNGFKRYIIPLNGELQIKHENSTNILLKTNTLYIFDGGRETESMHTNEQLQDFNIIVNKNYESDIKIIQDIDTQSILYSKYDIFIIYMLNATAIFNNIELIKGDLLIIKKKELVYFTLNKGDLLVGGIKIP